MTAAEETPPIARTLSDLTFATAVLDLRGMGSLAQVDNRIEHTFQILLTFIPHVILLAFTLYVH